MTEPTEEDYFKWLCAKVFNLRSNSNYTDLLWMMYCTPFVWVVPGDRNREQDGLELRTYFVNDAYVKNKPGWNDSPCSVLEMLIAFADRASFQTDLSSREWFWIFLNNLGLDDFRQVSDRDRGYIEAILQNFVWRTYDRNGNGNIFPLRCAPSDQRDLEIWWQFPLYLEEQNMM